MIIISTSLTCLSYQVTRLARASKASSIWGRDLAFNYYLEYAHQTDVGDNPIDYSADYYHLAPGLSIAGLTVTGGYEFLGSDDGRVAFATPLATPHIFNGFADVFLATPPTGLQDLYVDITYKMTGLSGSLAFLNWCVIQGAIPRL